MEGMNTRIDLSLDEYMRFAFTVQRQDRRNIRAKLIMMLGLFILAIVNFRGGNKQLGTIMIVAVVALPMFLDIMMKKQVTKAYSDNTNTQGINTSLTFYDNYYEGHSELGDNKYLYEELYKIIETPTNFYLMLSPQHGSIVIKENCSDELLMFLDQLKTRMDKEYGKK